MNDSPLAGFTLATAEPRRLFLTHLVTGQRLRNIETGDDAWIDLYSTDSEVAQKHFREMNRRRARLPTRRTTGNQLSPEEQEAETIELYVALTTGWSLCNLDGTPLNYEFTPRNARDLYAQPGALWMRRQIDDFVTDAANFMPSPSLH